jgi:general secretion pathway protein F
MAAFRYRALNLEGREISGVLEAETLRQARSQLRTQGLFPMDVAAEGGKREAFRPFGGRALGASARLLLTRQWATLLESGLTVEQALAALIEQAEDDAVRQVLAGIRSELLAGHPLHVALARFETSFDPLYRAIVEAGERSGQLALVMERLADMLEAGHALRQKIVQALVYPALIVAVAFAVVVGLMTWVVPQVVGVFQHGKQALPWLTRGLMAVSAALQVTWPFLLAAAVGGAWLFRRLLRERTFRRQWHLRLMKVPGLGRLLVTIDSARLAQTLAVLVGSGVPILGALDACRRVLSLEPLREGVEAAIKLVREGVSLHRGLAECRRFPPLLLHMIASGEASGRLDALLERAARQQQGEVANRLGLAVSILEPLLILLMGGVVLVIVVAILQPIIEINQLLR